jgi:hypothetical protein
VHDICIIRGSWLDNRVAGEVVPVVPLVKDEEYFSGRF